MSSRTPVRRQPGGGSLHRSDLFWYMAALNYLFSVYSCLGVLIKLLLEETEINKTCSLFFFFFCI